MAGLIVKSPYLKCGGKGGAVSGYMRYIATRERVQKVADSRPATQKQTQLAEKIARDFPDSRDLFEYEDWQAVPTRASASAFITTALECNWQAASQSEIYMRYIATRPRAERLGSHGLFGDGEVVDLQEAMDELDSFSGNVWTHIFSLKRGDAQRLGYDSADSWHNLLRAHRGEIAAAMDIPPGDFRWYAAYHDEGEHPHVHMMAWSASKQKPGYLTRDGIKTIRSKLTNEIFKQELLHTYQQKSSSRNELVRQTRRELLALVRTMQTGLCDHPQVETLMLQLAKGLESVRGKKSYGYLPKPLKALADQIVDQMERIPAVAQCYEKWQALQNQVQGYYADRDAPRPPLSQQKEFQAVKNAVIREAERIRTGEITFEDEGVSTVDEQEGTRYNAGFYVQYKDMIYNTDLPLDERDYAAQQMELAAKAGNPYAQHLMGKLYRDGTVVIPDAVRARDWFYKAATQQLNAAEYALGKLLLTDDSTVQDIPAGLRWLELAEQRGSSCAGYHLGKEYLQGKIVPKDTEKALEYLHSAADRYNQFAQYTLGKLYLLGQGVPQNRAYAEHWLKLSAEQGNQYARFFLDRLDQFCPPSALLVATNLLRQIGGIFADHSLPPGRPAGQQLDQKARTRLREKYRALGRKDEPEQEQVIQMSGY